MIKFHCHHCNRKISAETKYAGISTKCPSCGGDLIVPLDPPTLGIPSEVPESTTTSGPPRQRDGSKSKKRRNWIETSVCAVAVAAVAALLICVFAALARSKSHASKSQDRQDLSDGAKEINVAFLERLMIEIHAWNQDRNNIGDSRSILAIDSHGVTDREMLSLQVEYAELVQAFAQQFMNLSRMDQHADQIDNRTATQSAMSLVGSAAELGRVQKSLDGRAVALCEKYGVSAESTQRRDLSEYCTIGNLKAVKQLATKSNVNKAGERGFPLNAAAESGNIEVVKYLIDTGAHINIPDGWGLFPIHLAAMKGDLPTLKLLISAGAKIDQKSGIPSEDELLSAVRRGSGSDPNNECQPIHIAARWNRSEVVKYLLDQGVAYNAKDNKGSTPLDYLIKNLGYDKSTMDLVGALDKEGKYKNISPKE